MIKTYEDQMHQLGRIFGTIVLVAIFLVPIIICTVYNIYPPIKNLVIGIGMVCMIYVPVTVAEFLTYTPLLGTGGSYLVFTTGNLTNLKIPCAVTCMDNAGAKPGSEEGEVFSTLAIAASSIVTTVIIFIGMLAIIPLQPILSLPVLQPAFQNILPALFGALSAYWIQKQWKLAIVPILFVAVLFNLVPVLLDYAGALIPVMGLISILSARIMYKTKFITSFND